MAGYLLHQPSSVPFMQYADNRELRKELFMAYSSRCFRNNRHDNREMVKRIVNLRLRLANILGFRRYSDMVLEEMMAGSTERVESFLAELHTASYPAARRDYNELMEFAAGNGHTGQLERWDWAYWSEKLKMKKFNIDDQVLRPYFRLDRVEEAIFDLAGSLYGIKFKQLEADRAYHSEVRVFEVTENDGSHLGILMTDYHPRPGKSGGAWMTNFREQYVTDAGEVRPVISIVTNFSRPSGDKPSLLTHNELTTFLHEFGHAMHGMLTRCRYASLSGTNVARDFVELPSQIMENWAYEMDWLNTWATHYITGEKIPSSVIEKIKELSQFNEGYACNRQLGFGFLDMAWHTIEKEFTGDLSDFERSIMEPVQLFGTPEGTNLSSAFGHLFSGGYASGYYGYKWAEVLDADAFSLFSEKGITSKEVAAAFRKNILEKGATEKPSLLYSAFRGGEPSIDPLLVRSGFKKE
ncbi:MAG: M3 family metallopeptidase [Bacteroidales bacterium]